MPTSFFPTRKEKALNSILPGARGIGEDFDNSVFTLDYGAFMTSIQHEGTKQMLFLKRAAFPLRSPHL